MNAKEWFDQQLAEFENDPEFVAEELVLEIIASFLSAMEQQGISRSELAERLGTSRAFVSGVLNGKPNMTILTLAKFATALGLKTHLAFGSKVGEKATQPAETPRAVGKGLRPKATANTH